MGSITDATILHHVALVLLFLWVLDSFKCSHPSAYFLSLIYIYLIHEGYVLKLRKKLQFEEKRDTNQRRVLTDSETIRWLNHAIEKIWPVCMEEIVSQKILLPIVPWFLKKYKPWTAKDIEVQHLYLGRAPPIFTEVRVLQQSNGDDHLVLEIGMNFRTAEDMSAILAVKLRKRLGFGMWTKLHLLGMHIEGKVLVGVKFLRGWPFIGRLRVCFAGPPYFQMTVKPLFTHGLDVTEVPGIAGWIDNLLALVFEQTLVEPNMLVVDVEKFASPQPENWFSVDAKEPIAHAIVEVLEATEMRPSDLNGFSDPYLKGHLGPYRFRTKTQKKTLSPKWQEEFKIPISTWESQNMLVMEVRDKDRLFDDMLGTCSVNIRELRDGQRHELWLPLQNAKMGRVHLAVTVLEGNGKGAEPSYDATTTGSAQNRTSSTSSESTHKRTSSTDDFAPKRSLPSRSEKSPLVADKFEPIDIEGTTETGIWIHHPGSEVAQVWEPRKGKSSHNLNSHVRSDSCELLGGFKPISGQNDGSSSDESIDSNKPHANRVRRGLKKISLAFRKSPRGDDKPSPHSLVGDPSPSPHDNIRALNAQGVGVRLIIDDSIAPPLNSPRDDEKELLEGSGLEGQHQGGHKDMAKRILKHAGKSAHTLKAALSRKASRKSRAESGSLPADLEDCSDDESSVQSSTDIAHAESGLVIPGTAVSSPAPGPGNNSSDSKDSVVQKGTLSGNKSFKSTDNAALVGARSGDNSFKQVDSK